MPETEVRIAFRIPGDWSHPRELIERLPEGFRITAESLVLPDGTEVEFIPMQADDQFPEIFKSSCRRPATKQELEVINRYTVNILLAGPGGSPAAAATMMQAAAAIISAGGAGVFIDNSGLAHGGDLWTRMTNDGSSDALSFAFVSIICGEELVYTMGMHVLGFPDLIMKRADADANEDAIIEVIRYVAGNEKPIGDGHLLADENGPRFQTVAVASRDFPPNSPMYNPFGSLKLVNIKKIELGD